MVSPNLSAIIDNIEIDAQKIHEASSQDGIVEPRDGDPYNSIPKVVREGEEKIEEVVKAGKDAIDNFETELRQKIQTAMIGSSGFIIVPDIATLNTIVPTENYKGAVLYSGQYYSWNPAVTAANKWQDTGRNVLSEANIYTDEVIDQIGLIKKHYSQIDLKALATLQGFIGTNGAFNSSTSFRCTDFIPVVEGQVVNVVAKGHGSVATVALYSSNQTLIQNYTSGTEPYNVAITLSAAVAFIRVSYTLTSTVTQTGTLTQPLVYKDVTEKADFQDLVNNNNYVNATIKYAGFDKIGNYTINGTTFSVNTGFASFTPIAVKKGQAITAYIYGSTGGAAGLFFKNTAGAIIKTNFVGSTSAFETLTYTPTEDGVYWVNTVIPTDPTFIYAKKYRAGYYLPPSAVGVDVPSQRSFDDLAGIVNSHWKGKKIVWVGTSIPATDQNGKSYPVLVGEKLGCTMVNQAIGESWISFNKANPSTAGQASYKTMSATKQEIRDLAFNLWGTTEEPVLAKMEKCSYEYLLLGSGADLVVFDHMHNDIGRSYITYADGEIDSMDRTSFYGAYNYVIDKLYKDNPNVRIVFVSPPNRFLRANPGYTLEKFDAFRNALRRLADKYNALFIDLALLSNTNQSNYQSWTRTADGVSDDIHPGSAARVRYANILAEAIRSVG